MKQLLIILAFCVVAVPCSLGAVETLSPTTIIVVDSVSGTVSDMAIQGTYGTGFLDAGSIQQTYLMFDLTGLTSEGDIEITAATFSVTIDETGQYIEHFQDPLAFLNHVEDDLSSAFDWDSQPLGQIGDTYGDSVNMASADTITWDLIATAWDWEYDLNNGYLTLLLNPEYSDYNNRADFSNPLLSLDVTPVPEPATITLTILGLSSMMAVRKRKL